MKYIIIFLISFSIYGQTGSITGRAIDISTKLGLPGVTIVVVDSKLGAVTDVNGDFIIENIPIGTINLKASYVGYNSIIKSDIIVNPATKVFVEFSLEQSTIELDGVTVTSGFFQKDPRESNSVSNFSYEEIRRSPGGFEDVIRALSVLPGVAQADAGRNDLIVRGGAPSENLYIVDNIVVPNINHFGSQGATGGPLSYIDLNFVKETSFSAGGFSAVYGDKLSSVLRIDLREGDKERFRGKLLVSASQFGLGFEGPVGDNFTYLFSARRSYLDFIFKAAGNNFIPEYYDITSKMKYKFDKLNSLSFLFIGAFDNVKFDNDEPDQRYDNSRILGTDQIQYVAGLTFSHSFEKGYIDFTLSRNFVDFNSSQRDSLLNPLFQNDSREQENVLKIDNVYKLNKNSELNFGVVGKYIKFEADIVLPSFNTSFGDTLLINNLVNNSKFYKAGSYLQYIFRPIDRLKLNGGIRVDYFPQINEEFVVSPRLSLSYQLFSNTSINISGGIYHQSPSYIWLASFDNEKNLKNITVNQLVAGFENYVQEDLLLRVEGFYKYYEDYPVSTLRPYLILANTGAGFAGSDDNYSSFGLEPLVSGGKGNVSGVELLIQKKASGSHYGLLSLTYSKAKFKIHNS